MTSTLDATALHRAAAGTAALLVGRLPFVFEPSPVSDRPGALVSPGEGSLALSAGIAGVEGSTVILALPAPVIAALVDGPLGHQELSDALTPVLTDAVAGLEPLLGRRMKPRARWGDHRGLGLVELGELPGEP